MTHNREYEIPPRKAYLVWVVYWGSSKEVDPVVKKTKVTLPREPIHEKGETVIFYNVFGGSCWSSEPEIQKIQFQEFVKSGKYTIVPSDPDEKEFQCPRYYGLGSQLAGPYRAPPAGTEPSAKRRRTGESPIDSDSSCPATPPSDSDPERERMSMTSDQERESSPSSSGSGESNPASPSATAVTTVTAEVVSTKCASPAITPPTSVSPWEVQSDTFSLQSGLLDSILREGSRASPGKKLEPMFRGPKDSIYPPDGIYITTPDKRSKLSAVVVKLLERCGLCQTKYPWLREFYVVCTPNSSLPAKVKVPASCCHHPAPQTSEHSPAGTAVVGLYPTSVGLVQVTVSSATGEEGKGKSLVARLDWLSCPPGDWDLAALGVIKSRKVVFPSGALVLPIIGCDGFAVVNDGAAALHSWYGDVVATLDVKLPGKVLHIAVRPSIKSLSKTAQGVTVTEEGFEFWSLGSGASTVLKFEVVAAGSAGDFVFALVKQSDSDFGKVAVVVFMMTGAYVASALVSEKAGRVSGIDGRLCAATDYHQGFAPLSANSLSLTIS